MRLLAAKLDELRIPYAICGGLAVFAHGHLRATSDVDVLLTPEGLRQFKAAALGLDRFAGSNSVKDMEQRVPIDILLTGGTPGRTGKSKVVFADPARVAVLKDGRRYVALPTLIEMKLASGLDSPDRLQDFADVIQLIRANALPQSLAAELHPEVQAKYLELWGHAQLPPVQS